MDTQIPQLTTVIAIYGAILATLGLALSLWLGIIEVKRHRTRVRVNPSRGRLIDPKGNNSEPMILVEAINIGNGMVTITGVGWLLDNKHRLQVIRPYMLLLPYELHECKKLTFIYPCRCLDQLKDSDRIVGAFFSDEVGNLWKCRIPKRVVRQWKAASPDGWLLEW
jgi:hypothetical protein